MLRFSLISCLFVTVLCSSCKTNTDDEQELNDQNRFFVNYIQNTYGTNSDSLELIANNLYMITREEGTGASPVIATDSADYVQVAYTGRVLSGSLNYIFTTTNPTLTSKLGLVSVSISDTVYLNMGNTYLPGTVPQWTNGLRKGLMSMKEGGKARILMGPQWGMGSSGYAKSGDNYYTNNVPSYASLSYDVHLIKVIRNPYSYDNERLTKCLQVFNKTTNDSVKKAGAAVYLVSEGVATNDTLATAGDSVYISYTGRLLPKKESITTRADVLSGAIFDHSTNSGFLVDNTSTTGKTVEGFNAALKNIKLGTSGIIIIPYKAAYGASGKLPNIPQYSSIIFEYKVLRIKR